jgi:hypothetical protein
VISSTNHRNIIPVIETKKLFAYWRSTFGTEMDRRTFLKQIRNAMILLGTGITPFINLSGCASIPAFEKDVESIIQDTPVSVPRNSCYVGLLKTFDFNTPSSGWEATYGGDYGKRIENNMIEGMQYLFGKAPAV